MQIARETNTHTYIPAGTEGDRGIQKDTYTYIQTEGYRDTQTDRQ